MKIAAFIPKSALSTKRMCGISFSEGALTSGQLLLSHLSLLFRQLIIVMFASLIKSILAVDLPTLPTVLIPIYPFRMK